MGYTPQTVPVPGWQYHVTTERRWSWWKPHANVKEQDTQLASPGRRISASCQTTTLWPRGDCCPRKGASWKTRPRPRCMKRCCWTTRRMAGPDLWASKNWKRTPSQYTICATMEYLGQRRRARPWGLYLIQHVSFKVFPWTPSCTRDRVWLEISWEFFFVFEKTQLLSSETFPRCFCRFASQKKTHTFTDSSGEIWTKPGSPRCSLCRVLPFGDKPAPDMASFVMLKIAKANESDNPDAAATLRRDRYMDDVIHFCQTPEQTIQHIKQLDRVLATGSFRIKEWLCSSGMVRDELTFGAEVKESDETKSDAREQNGPQSQAAEASVLHTEATKSETSRSPAHRETGTMPDQDAVTSINLDGEKGIKTLGVGWNPHTDMLHFAVKDIKVDKLTKRTVLSSISKLYDPLVLASAVTIIPSSPLPKFFCHTTNHWCPWHTLVWHACVVQYDDSYSRYTTPVRPTFIDDTIEGNRHCFCHVSILESFDWTVALKSKTRLNDLFVWTLGHQNTGLSTEHRQNARTGIA